MRRTDNAATEESGAGRGTARGYSGATLAQGGLSALGFGTALCEVFIGFGLLLGRTRKLCVWLALAMHALILGLLAARGRNIVVWAWNVALMLIVPILFLRGGESVPRAFTCWRAADSINRAMRALALGAAVLPLLSFWGLWEMNLSRALYADNKAVAVARVERPVYDRLPAAALRHVFETRGGELMLPVFEWSMADRHSRRQLQGRQDELHGTGGLRTGTLLLWNY